MPREIRGQISHEPPPVAASRSPAPRACRRPPRPPLRGRRSRNRRRRNTSDWRSARSRGPPRSAVRRVDPATLAAARVSRDLPDRGNHHVARQLELRCPESAARCGVRSRPARRARCARTSRPPRGRLRSMIATGCASQWKCTPSTLRMVVLEGERRHLFSRAAVEQMDTPRRPAARAALAASIAVLPPPITTTRLAHCEIGLRLVALDETQRIDHARRVCSPGMPSRSIAPSPTPRR